MQKRYANFSLSYCYDTLSLRTSPQNTTEQLPLAIVYVNPCGRTASVAIPHLAAGDGIIFLPTENKTADTVI